MTDLRTIEIKAYVPARDFTLSQQFYRDFGFKVEPMSDQMAFCHCDGSSFLLQNYYVKEYAENFMMHILVQDVESWWDHIVRKDIGTTYGVMIEPISNKPWGLRDFAVADPAGVLWRIGQEIVVE